MTGTYEVNSPFFLNQCFKLDSQANQPVTKGKKTRAVTKCDLIPASALTDTSILYTDGPTHDHGWTDKLIPVYP